MLGPFNGLTERPRRNPAFSSCCDLLRGRVPVARWWHLWRALLLCIAFSAGALDWHVGSGALPPAYCKG